MSGFLDSLRSFFAASNYRHYTLVNSEANIQAEFIFPDSVTPNTHLGDIYIKSCIADVNTKLGLSLDFSDFNSESHVLPFTGKYLADGILDYHQGCKWRLNTNHYMFRSIGLTSD